MDKRIDKFIEIFDKFSYDEFISFNPDFSKKDWKISEDFFYKNKNHSGAFYLLKNNPYKNFDIGVQKLIENHGNKKKVYSFLGDIYSLGDYTDPDKEKSIYYYKKAANLGDVYAQYRLGLLQYKTLNNKTEAVCWLEKAANNLWAEAQYNLYEIYSNRQDGFYSPFKAVFWLEEAEKQKHFKASYDLGEIYLNGNLGQKKDYKKAFSYFEVSAKRGNPDAMYQIALASYIGHNIKRDHTKAKEVLDSAIEIGEKKEFLNISKAYYIKGKILHKEKKYLEALRNFYVSASMENSKAEYMIGNYFYKKIVLDFDYEEAIYWYEKAAEKGDRKAVIKLLRLKNPLVRLKSGLRKLSKKDEIVKKMSKREKTVKMFLIGFHDMKRDKVYWGYSNLNKKTLIAPELEDQNLMDCFRTDKFIPFIKNSKVGVLNKRGRMIIENEYESISSYSEGLFAVKKNNKYAYIDDESNIVIDFSFEKAEEFFNEKAKVKKDGLYGYIDEDGEFLISNSYESIDEISENLYLVKTEKGYNYIDENENYSFNEFYEELGIESEGLIRAKKDGLWGFLDLYGKVVIDFTYDFVSNFYNSNSKVMINKKWGTINKKGNLIIKPFYEKLFSISEKYDVGIKNKKIEIIGKCFLNDNIEYIEPFYKGFSRVRIGDKYNFLNENFQLISEFNFDNVKNFENSYAPVAVGKKWGFINEKGKIVIAPKYDEVRNFNEDGLAMVQYKGYIAYIDKEGDFFYRTDREYFKELKREYKKIKMDNEFFDVLYYEKDNELKKFLRTVRIYEIALFLKLLSKKRRYNYLYNKIIKNSNKIYVKKVKNIVAGIGEFEFLYYANKITMILKEAHLKFKKSKI